LRLARHDTALRKASPLGKAPPDTASTSLLVSLPSRHPRRGSLLSLCRVEGEEFHAQYKVRDFHIKFAHEDWRVEGERS
jgi:hypothetical protein